MTKGVAGAVLIAALVAGIGMAAPAFAKHDNGQGGGWNGGANPPGWSHGNKTGWGGRGMPPGLYKKYYSNRSYSNRYNGSSYYQDYPNYYGGPGSYHYGGPGSYYGY